MREEWPRSRWERGSKVVASIQKAVSQCIEATTFLVAWVINFRISPTPHSHLCLMCLGHHLSYHTPFYHPHIPQRKSKVFTGIIGANRYSVDLNKCFISGICGRVG